MGLRISLVWISKPVVLRSEEGAMSVFFSTVFALLFVAVAVSTNRCVVCRHFCCPMLLLREPFSLLIDLHWKIVNLCLLTSFMSPKILINCVRLICIDQIVVFHWAFYLHITFYHFPQVIGAKVINVTLTITNKECNEDDQSFWQSVKEAVTDNTFFWINN